MKNKKIIFQVTRSYMRRNKKRTFATFLGIILMVVLLTCVFVGKDTVFSYLTDIAVAKRGSWHVVVYNVDRERYEKIRKLDYMAETAVSYDLGFTDCEVSRNAEKPYWEVKGYSRDCFDWMNISLKEGRYPENDSEIMISQSVIDDGADIHINDTVTAQYFERYMEGINPDVSETFFPLSNIRIRYGEKVKVKQDFPFMEENDDFREVHEETGGHGTYKIVGIMNTPDYESESGSFYAALTSVDNQIPAEQIGNVVCKFDLQKLPTSYGYADDLCSGKEDAYNEIEYNDMVLVFSEESSEDNINRIVHFVMLFFTVLIILISIILIYNMFNISFEERKKYLGMLTSVGATSRQRKSSVYYESFLLLIVALPLGILLGLGMVRLGMQILNPQILKMMNGTDGVPVAGSLAWSMPDITLCVKATALLVIVLTATVTVVLSSYLPARKIGKCNLIESIRGNNEVRKKERKKKASLMEKRNTIKALAWMNLRTQRQKTRSIVRSIAAFMIILTVTVFGAEMVTGMVTFRLVNDDSTLETTYDGYDAYLREEQGYGGTYNAIKQEIMNHPDVEEVREWQSGLYNAGIEPSVLSDEYWEDLCLIANEYFEEPFTIDSFRKYMERILERSVCVYAVDDETYETIAKKCGADMEILCDEKQNSVLFYRDIELSTAYTGFGEGKAKNYRFFEVENPTNLLVGDTFDVKLYNGRQGKMDALKCTLAGYVTAEDIEEYFKFGDGSMWIIVGTSTIEKMNQILAETEDYTGDGNYQTFTRKLLVTMKNKDGALAKKIAMANTNQDEPDYYLEMARDDDMDFDPVTLAQAINRIIDIVAVCFVLFASFICLLNLFNSVRGRAENRKKEIAMLRSAGMEQKQIDRMLFGENRILFVKGVLWSLFFSLPGAYYLKETMMNYFGYIRIAFPWAIYVLSGLITAVSLFLISKHCYSFGKNDNILEDLT